MVSYHGVLYVSSIKGQEWMSGQQRLAMEFEVMDDA